MTLIGGDHLRIYQIQKKEKKKKKRGGGRGRIYILEVLTAISSRCGAEPMLFFLSSRVPVTAYRVACPTLAIASALGGRQSSRWRPSPTYLVTNRIIRHKADTPLSYSEHPLRLLRHPL